jgi:glycosyltransferase involved in cell wall biosynthesis
VRILVVTPTVPWPARSGLRIRIASTVRSLAAFGDVDVFSLSRDGAPGARPIPAGEPIDAWRVAEVRLRSRDAVTRARLVLGRRPRVVAVRDYTHARRALTEWAVEYDLVWCCQVESLSAVASPIDAPLVVDLDDHEGHKLRSARRLAVPSGVRPGAVLRSQATRWDARRWDRLQLQAAQRADVAVVASEADRSRFGITGLVVVPNAYPCPEAPVGRATVSVPPVISFVGLLTYPPNADAVRQLAREVVPRVHDHDPSVQFRVVGRHDDDLPRDCPGLLFVGEVDEVAPELARADVVAVPLRFGSGTRVKILEAFAHRVPVVSTHVGAEGLSVGHGEHLLLADDPDEFAEACVRLLRDVGLRARLAAAAHDLWAAEHGPAAFQRSIERVVESVTVNPGTAGCARSR